MATRKRKSPGDESREKESVGDSRQPRFFNRELSWMEFNQRVLEEARNPANPLLERLKFLAITASNLDEFTAVRVGSLQRLVKQGGASSESDDLPPAEQLHQLMHRMRRFTSEQYGYFLTELEPLLNEAGINRILPDALSERQRRVLETVFQEEIYPIISPMAVQADEFPLLINQTLNLCVRTKPRTDGESRFAIVPFGRNRQRFITLPVATGYGYMLLEDVVRLMLQQFFPDEKIEDCVPFRITRNADLEVQEDSASDLLQGLEQILTARKESDCVRLELAEEACPETRAFLQQALHVPDDQLFSLPGPLDLAAYWRLADLPGFERLRDDPWPPLNTVMHDAQSSLFDQMAQRDLLLFHPYESFDPIVRLVDEAADDPDVLAIKQTLYRTSARSPIVAALKRAAQKGKTVTVVVELKARFDEARNIEWARDLERSDVQVIYGVKGYKTHAKICLIIRREPEGIRRYIHFGTGNYNEQTAKIYSDASLLTANEELGADATAFFHAITGYSLPMPFKQIEAAPLGLRDKLLQMLDNEIDEARRHSKAFFWGKLNSLVCPKMISKLYEASQAGVKIRLNIRGMCCLRPGVPGLSENITVTSVIDRFLEHARVLYFHSGGDERVFISSADWMPRNLDRRVELLIPILDPGCRERLIGVLKTQLADTVKARQLQPDGSWRAVAELAAEDGSGAKLAPIRSQAELYRRVREALDRQEPTQVSMFEPHRAPGQGDE